MFKKVYILLTLLSFTLHAQSVDVVNEEFFASDYRLMIDATITDRNGIVDARLYFKRAKDQQFHFFAPMKCKGKLCRGYIPAPHSDTQKVEYKVVYKNKKKMIFSSDNYRVKKRELLALQMNQTKDKSPFVIKTEFAKQPTLYGFADNYSIKKVAIKDKFGVLADMLTQQEAGVKDMSQIDVLSYSGIGIDIPPYAAIGVVLLVLVL